MRVPKHQRETHGKDDDPAGAGQKTHGRGRREHHCAQSKQAKPPRLGYPAFSGKTVVHLPDVGAAAIARKQPGVN